VTRQWSVRLVAGLAVVAALLSGCSEKQPANETLPSASPAETTPELPPLGPEDMPMPDEARTQDAAGAEAFVRYYIGLINRTSDVMDAESLRALSDGCRQCDRIADGTEQDASLGYRYEGGQLTVIAFGEPSVSDSTSEMVIRVDQAPLTVVDASGAPVPNRGSGAFAGLSGGAALRWDAGRQTWLVTNLTFG
jgi:hypothetical protein